MNISANESARSPLLSAPGEDHLLIAGTVNLDYPFSHIAGFVFVTDPDRLTRLNALCSSSDVNSPQSGSGILPVYVKDQMGHGSIQVTVDLYGHLIPGGNTQAVDRLDIPVLPLESATPAQPAAVVTGPISSDQLNYPVVTRSGFGVDDGFRTRDLRIHNPAL